MADSKRQKIVDAVVARMKTILVTNGFATDIGTTVEDSQTNWDENQLPAISVFDPAANAEAPANPGTAQYTIWTQAIQVRVYLKAETDAKNARKAIKDVWQAVRSDSKWTLSGEQVAMFTVPVSEGFIYPPDSYEIVGVSVEFNVMYKTQKFNAEV
jgi:hypothetical protein